MVWACLESDLLTQAPGTFFVCLYVDHFVECFVQIIADSDSSFECSLVDFLFSSSSMVIAKPQI